MEESENGCLRVQSWESRGNTGSPLGPKLKSTLFLAFTKPASLPEKKRIMKDDNSCSKNVVLKSDPRTQQ